MNDRPPEPIEILLVEDNPGDARLTFEALHEARVSNGLHHVKDGIEALAYLRREGRHANALRPDLILLDLNLPRMDGRELLGIIKGDASLGSIPVIVLTTSQAEEDILKSYALHANCYISKPVDLSKFVDAVCAVSDFWLSVVRLPRPATSGV